MRHLRSLLLLLLCGGLALPLVAADDDGDKPAVLFLTWGVRGNIDYDFLKTMQKAGFKVDYTQRWDEVSWERLSKYNAILLESFPHEAEGEVRNLIGNQTDGPDVAATRALLKRYLEAGGGILWNLHRTGQNPWLYRTIDTVLKEDFDARLPLELIAAPVTAEGWHPRLRMEFMYTRNVLESPVSEGVAGVWYPNPPYGRRVSYTRYAGPLALGDSWQVVLRAPAGSRSYPYAAEHAATFPKRLQIMDPYTRPEGVPEPPLFAIREAGGGRLAMFHCMSIFHTASGNTWFHNGAMLNKGLNGKPSDFGQLLVNTFGWLCAPSLGQGQLGGAVEPPEISTPRMLREANREVTAFRDQARDLRQVELDPTAPPAPVTIRRGLIGARSSHAGGQGSAGDYAAAAERAGLDFVVFLDPFSELTEQELEQLRADCEAASNDQVLLMAGYRMDSNIGNRMFFYGMLPMWPDERFLSHRDPHKFRLQGEMEDGTFWQRDMGLGFLIKDFLGRRKDRVAVNNIGYFDFQRARELGGMQPQHCKAFGAFGLMFYENGKLVEDVTDQYLLTNAGTMTALPLVINLVDSPAALEASVARGDAMTCVVANTLAELPERLNKNHQFESPPVFVSSGPEIRQWFEAYRPFVYGNELFVNARGIMDSELHVTAEQGLAEVAVYNGTRLFRRFLPGGDKEFHARLYLSAFMQQHLTVVATDTAGGKAVGFPRFCKKPSSAQAVGFCGDHVNHCTNINMKMSRGPSAPRQHSLPAVADAGHTWDGAPSPWQALAQFDTLSLLLETAEGPSQAATPYQHPRMAFASERVYRGDTVIDGVLDTPGNPWRGWGPILPVPLYDGHHTYTEFGRYMTGVDTTSWGGPGKGGGTIAGLYEHRLRFVAGGTLTRFNLLRGKRELVPGLRAMLLVGRGRELLGARDFSAATGGPAGQSVSVPAGGWFAGVVTAGAANDFICFTDQDLEISFSPDRIDMHVALPPDGLPLTAGQEHLMQTLTYVWPMDVSLESSDNVLKLIDYLRQPTGLTMLQGEHLADGANGLFELRADRGGAEFTVTAPPRQALPEVSPALRLHGLNPRWSAGCLQVAGYGGARYYSNGQGQYMPLGVDDEGRAYASVYSFPAPRTHWRLGHPVIADEAGAALFIQVTPLAGPFAKDHPAAWHVAVNNPTDAPVTTTLRRRLELPGLAFTEAAITLAPGEYRILEHGAAPQPAE